MNTVLTCNYCGALFICKPVDGEIPIQCELCIARAKRSAA